VSSFKVSACSWLTRIHVSYEEEDTCVIIQGKCLFMANEDTCVI